MRRLAALAVVVGAVACGGRPAFWDTDVESELNMAAGVGAVGVLDAPLSRVIMLSAHGDLTLTTTAVQIGKTPVALRTTVDRDKLLVLSRGDVPRDSATDEAPSVTVIDAGTSPKLRARYALSDPLSGLQIDPHNVFAVVYATATDESFVSNPNELIFIDITAPPSPTNPLPRTIRSFGGRPLRLDFTNEVSLPSGKHRLLVAQTDRDVSLVDLGNLTGPEVTIRLVESGKKMQPAEIAVTDGSPERDDDAKIALRVSGDSNVVVLDLLPPTSPTQGAFRTVPNVVALGAVPSDLAFVRTDAGDRLAAMVPSQSAVYLVAPETGQITSIPLGQSFQRIALVSDVVGAGPEGADTALVWTSERSVIGLVALGKTGTPHKSVELLTLDQPVIAVHSVPAKNAHLKVLETPGHSFFVLNLAERTVAPLVATKKGVRLHIASDGGRAWAHVEGQELAKVDLADLHPSNLRLRRAIGDVFDIQRSDGGRALLAMHNVGALGVTVVDARTPSLTTAREYAGVLLGGAQ